MADKKAARPRVVWRGDHYEVLRPGEPLLATDIDDIERLDAQVRASAETVAALAQQVEALTSRLSEATALVEMAAQCHARFASDVERFAKVLMLPTIPLYDKNGKVAAVQRVDKLPEGLHP